MLHYITQVIVFQLVFLLVYELLLKRETFFSYNRGYLLATPVIAMLLPFLKIPFLQEAIPADAFVMLPEVFIGTPPEVISTGAASEATTGNSRSGLQINWWLMIYVGGAALSFMLFLKKFSVLRQLFRFKTVRHKNGLKIIEVPNSRIACTFYNTIFLGEQLSEEEKEQVLSHELVHVQERHTVDLLYFEILKILFWFNPLIYIYQSRITTLHEFIADAGVVKTVEKQTYYQQLLNTAFNTRNISFINQFFNHSLIKKRIVMLQKSRSKSISKVKFLIILPLMLAMLTYVSCSDDNEVIENETTQLSNEDELLKENLRQELLQMEEDGAEFMEIANAFMTEKDAHIKSKEAFYRFNVYSEHIFKKSAELQKEKGTWDAEGAEKHEKMLEEIRNKTYEDYVEYRKTQTPKTTTRTQVGGTVGDVPFAVIEEVPVFPGCEDLASNEERKACMSQKVTEFVNMNFNTALGKELGLKGVNRIYVQFRINKDGSIDVLGARAARPELQEEAERVVNSLPDMQPGKQSGEAVGVLYSLPITFKVGE